MCHLTNTTSEPYDTYCAIDIARPSPQHHSSRNNDTPREQGTEVKVHLESRIQLHPHFMFRTGNTKAYDNRKAATATYSPRCIRCTTSPQPVQDTFLCQPRTRLIAYSSARAGDTHSEASTVHQRPPILLKTIPRDGHLKTRGAWDTCPQRKSSKRPPE